MRILPRGLDSDDLFAAHAAVLDKAYLAAASRKKGGMGIQIVRQTMDHVLYARRDGRTKRTK